MHGATVKIEDASMLRCTHIACLDYLSLRLFLTHTFVQVAYIHLARILQPQQFGGVHIIIQFFFFFFRKLDTKLRFEPGNVLELPLN